MAQTVSLQRGSVTYTARGDVTSNITTLFTNTSSGSGTRVIVNYVVVNNPFATASGINRSYTVAGYLGSVSSGTTGTIHGWIGNVGSSMSGQMAISDPGSNVFVGSTSTQAYNMVNFYNSQVAVNETGWNNMKPSNITANYTSNSYISYCPRNFYIGPSDVVKWWPITSSYTTPSGKQSITTYVTQTLYYSFTCITES